MSRSIDTFPRGRDNPFPRLVLGLTILTAGVLLWLDHLGRLDASDYLRWWPAAVVAFGLAQFPHRQWVSGAIWTAIGLVLLLPMLGYPSLAFFRLLGLWPLVYAAAGAALLTQALRARSGQPAFQALAVMAGNVRRLGTVEFTGGDAIAIMGACEVDLSSARLTREGVIDVVAFWGGIGIKVPRGWRIDNRTTAILGGVDDRTDGAPETAPQLVIRGSVIMGGVEIKYGAGAAA